MMFSRMAATEEGVLSVKFHRLTQPVISSKTKHMFRKKDCGNDSGLISWIEEHE